MATLALLDAGTASAQCVTCPTQTVAYSPVVYTTYQTTYDGWYPGKLIGRLGQRLFGTAPAPATVPAYTAAYPTTYAAAYPTYSVSYAPATYATAYAPTYATSYAPATCATCTSSPCCCATQTTYRPVIMQPVDQCSTCSGVTTTSYAPAVASPGCTNCTANYADQAVYTQSVQQQPDYYQQPQQAPRQADPPRTFREAERPAEPTPANGTSSGNAASWDPPMLIGPNDKQAAKRPNTTVWTAVYQQPTSQPASVQQTVSTQAERTAPQQPKVRWVGGE